MARANLAGVPNLREAIRYARQLGLTIERVGVSGEIRIRDPLQGRSVITSSERQSTSRALRKLLGTAEHLRRPTPAQLFEQAEQDPHRFAELLRRHGYPTKRRER